MTLRMCQANGGADEECNGSARAVYEECMAANCADDLEDDEDDENLECLEACRNAGGDPDQCLRRCGGDRPGPDDPDEGDRESREERAAAMRECRETCANDPRPAACVRRCLADDDEDDSGEQPDPQ